MFGGLGSLFGGGGMFSDDNSSTDVSSGGIGNSTSENLTSNYDASVNAGNESTVNSNTTLISGGTNTLTDHGAVSQSLALALRGIEGSNKLTSEAMAAQGGLLTGALRLAGEQQNKAMETLNNVKTADVRVLIIAGMSVIALAAVGFMARRKAA